MPWCWQKSNENSLVSVLTPSHVRLRIWNVMSVIMSRKHLQIEIKCLCMSLSLSVIRAVMCDTALPDVSSIRQRVFWTWCRPCWCTSCATKTAMGLSVQRSIRWGDMLQPTLHCQHWVVLLASLLHIHQLFFVIIYHPCPLTTAIHKQQ